MNFIKWWLTRIVGRVGFAIMLVLFIVTANNELYQFVSNQFVAKSEPAILLIMSFVYLAIILSIALIRLLITPYFQHVFNVYRKETKQ